MRIAFEGPELTVINFDNILNIKYLRRYIVVFYCRPNLQYISTCTWL